ncbi:hypothetical protein PF003_g32800 [Phytophthora fragariae]|nr:hypothetical protein PF003_g32800 [Phytophthora fragariae]
MWSASAGLQTIVHSTRVTLVQDSEEQTVRWRTPSGAVTAR